MKNQTVLYRFRAVGKKERGVASVHAVAISQDEKIAIEAFGSSVRLRDLVN